MTTPAFFIGHGSPETAVAPNPYSPLWARWAGEAGKPRAVLCVSAHWETDGVRVTSSPRPETIHDFYGFGPDLYAKRYPAPGAPDVAAEVLDLLGEGAADPARGLDHGAWGPLCRMWPDADVPVVQLSLDRRRTPAQHLELAAKLAPLRERGILIIGSGDIVHNLGALRFDGGDFPWAASFDAWAADRAGAGDLAALAADAQGPGRSPDARLAVPTPEHFLPFLYILSLRAPGEALERAPLGRAMGAVSMACFRLPGGPFAPGGFQS